MGPGPNGSIILLDVVLLIPLPAIVITYFLYYFLIKKPREAYIQDLQAREEALKMRLEDETGKPVVTHEIQPPSKGRWVFVLIPVILLALMCGCSGLYMVYMNGPGISAPPVRPMPQTVPTTPKSPTPVESDSGVPEDTEPSDSQNSKPTPIPKHHTRHHHKGRMQTRLQWHNYQLQNNRELKRTPA